MKFSVRILPLVMTLAAAGGFFSLHSQAVADTQHLVIDSGDSALSHEAAREYREHWDDNRLLRKKINTRNIKQFDKADRANDLRDACEESLNLNAYWESNTLRCLDRRTGRPLQP